MLIHSNQKCDSYAWFFSSYGRRLLAQERRYCMDMGGDTFGNIGLQIGHHFCHFVARLPMRAHAIVGNDKNCQIIADWTSLPFADDSVDLVVLAHALESSQTPHAVLREATRVLCPQGRLLIIGFNPWSLLGIKLWSMPWRQRWLPLARVKDWLLLLNVNIVSGKLGAFMPPHQGWKMRRRFKWMEKAGRRWWPLAGGVYYVCAIKQYTGMRLIGLPRRRLPVLTGVPVSKVGR